MENVTVYRPGVSQEFHRGSGKLTAHPILPGFELDLAALFRVVRDE
jgi:hypothetical protein